MKRALFVLCLAVSTAAAAEDIKIEDLRTPSSPAFVLMGIAPTVVERPTTPHALGASVLSSLNDASSTTAPKNYALDVAPYWLSSRPKLTYDQYNQPDFGQSLLQTLLISVATKQQTVATNTTPGSTLGGFGARAAWLFGKPSAIEGQLRTAIEKRATDLALSMGPVQPGEKPRDLQGDPEMSKLIDAFRSARYEGRWFVEVAGATTALFTQNNANQSQHQKTGFWITPSYRMSRTTFDTTTNAVTTEPNIDLLGVVRWISDHTTATPEQPIDLGARIIWTTGDLSVSAEIVERRRSVNNSSRTAVAADFKLSDKYYLTATFGKNFANENPNGNLLAIFGVHFGVGTTPIVSTSP